MSAQLSFDFDTTSTKPVSKTVTATKKAKPTTTAPVPSSDMQMRGLIKAESFLKAIGAEYIIKLPNGKTAYRGDMKLAPEKKKPFRTRRNPEAPHGTFTTMLRNAGFEKMEINQTLNIPIDSYHPESIRSTACSMAQRMWGNGAIMTAIHKDRVEILRVA